MEVNEHFGQFMRALVWATIVDDEVDREWNKNVPAGAVSAKIANQAAK